MSEMLERVAKAIYETGHPPDWDVAGEWYRELFRRQARAAIEAMREPTPEMVWVGNDEVDSLPDDQTVHPVWHAMIAAALHPQTK